MVNRFNFRVWDKENKYMFTKPYNDWEISKIKDFDYMFIGINGKLELAYDGCVQNACYNFYDHTKDYDENQYILMQSTGLTDKNGNELFEGDVVKLGNGSINGSVMERIFEVKWEINKFNIPNWIVEKPSFSHYIEKIGNIYENENLIKE